MYRVSVYDTQAWNLISLQFDQLDYYGRYGQLFVRIGGDGICPLKLARYNIIVLGEEYEGEPDVRTWITLA